nr:hypothetical protein [Duncaniella muris]
MKFDDSDEDYFLHDFSRKDRQSEEDQRHSPTPDPSDPATRPAAPSFDFSDGGSDSLRTAEAGETRRKRGHGWLWFFLVVAVVLAAAVTIR